MLCRLPLFSLLLLGASGCASTRRGAALPSLDSAAEAARARYRAIQAAQKPAPVSTTYEVVPLARPERTEDGIIRNPTTDYVRILRLP
jgi:hypothetical protein